MIKNPTHTVHVPQPLPAPYDTFHQDWKDWVMEINTQPIIVTNPNSSMTMGDQKTVVVGLWIKAGISPIHSSTAPWIPKEWASPINQKLNISSCNCPSRDLFLFGCKGHADQRCQLLL